MAFLKGFGAYVPARIVANDRQSVFDLNVTNCLPTLKSTN
jgi:hypothetical protein